MSKKAKFIKYCRYYNKEIRFKTGIYYIYHTKYPDKIYIGSASQTGRFKGFYDRFHTHYSDLKREVHCNDKLQNMVNKYGLDEIRFVPLEIYPPELCMGMEQFYLNTLNPYYNINTQASSTLGYRHTQKYLNKCRKSIVQYDLNGNFINEYSGIANTEKKLDIIGISECCRGRYRKAFGSIWKYKKDVLDKNNNIIKSIKPYKDPTAIKIIAYNLDGSFYKIYKSILEAGKDLGYNNGNISRSVRNKARKCGSYIFKNYTKDYKKKIKPYKKYHSKQLKVIITDTSTKEKIKYASFREAEKGNEISRSTLSKNYNNGNTEFIHKPYQSNKEYSISIIEYD